MAVTRYHNPRCGESRQGPALLRRRGMAPQLSGYPIEYAGDALDDPAPGRRTLSDMIPAHARMLVYPRVAATDEAVVGNPPEKMLEIV